MKNVKGHEPYQVDLMSISYIIFVMSLVIFFVGPELVRFRLQFWNITESGQIGDVFGGTVGPLIAWMAAVLTFAAFWVQYQANQEQRKQFEKNTIDSSIDRFEVRFATMIDIHRENVASVEINSEIAGRRAFELIFLELKMMYWLVHNYYHEDNETASPGFPVSEELIFEVAYLFFFFGCTEKSVPLIIDLVGPTFEDFVLNVEGQIMSYKYPENDEEILGDDDMVDPITEPDIQPPIIISTGNEDLYWLHKYEFASGHLTNLSHYIRHLFQTVKYVDDTSEKIISSKRKYHYVSNLRSQLSIYEQALLYYNSLSVLGEPWQAKHSPNNESYIEKYCLIKSLPIRLADFYKEPDYPTRNALGKSLFEWTEIEERMRRRMIMNRDLVVDDGPSPSV